MICYPEEYNFKRNLNETKSIHACDFLCFLSFFFFLDLLTHLSGRVTGEVVVVSPEDK